MRERWRRSGEASTSGDAIYASWSLYETNEPSHVSSESETEEKFTKQPPATVQNVQESICQILQQLSTVINEDNICKFNISRNHIWEGTVRALSRKSFCSQNKVSAEFCDDIGRSEGAVDLQGGPTREFITIVLEWIANSQFFAGTEKNKFLSGNASSHLNI